MAHCGGSLEGRFIWTLVATDIAIGWSESLPLVTRDGASVLAGTQRLRKQLPFPLRGIDADKDPAFMNDLIKRWCDAPEQGMELTRSRAYESNDQAWVEQKNGMLIRRVVDYEHMVGLKAAQLLAVIYAALRLFTNLFQPSLKLKSRVREGGRIKRQIHSPRTPLQKLLRTGVLRDQKAQGLRELRKLCDPVALLATMRSCQGRLALLIRGQRASAMACDPLSWQTPEEEKREMVRFLQGLHSLWRQSRPLQKKPKPRQSRRRRVDPFEAHADLMPQWLEAKSRCRQPGAPAAADRAGSRALWATTQTDAAEANQRLEPGQGATVPGEPRPATVNQAREVRKGVKRRHPNGLQILDAKRPSISLPSDTVRTLEEVNQLTIPINSAKRRQGDIESSINDPELARKIIRRKSRKSKDICKDICHWGPWI